MKKIAAFLTALLLLGTTGCTGGVPGGEDEADVTQTADWQLSKEVQSRKERLADISSENLDHLDSFTDRIAPLLLSAEGENRVCSPAGLFMALSMLGETTDGRTQWEILSTIGLRDNKGARRLNGILFDALCFDNEVGELRLANSLWLSKSYPFREGIAGTVEKEYRAELFDFDYTNPADGQRMADWIAAKTENKLNPEPFTLNEQSLAFLINTIYFKDQWTNQLDERNTAPAAFTLANGTEITCDFMQAYMERMNYAQGDDWVKVSKELRNGGAMSFILPAAGTTPGALLSDRNKCREMLGAQMEAEYCNLQLPKFDFQTKLDVVEALKELGIECAFDAERSEFSPLTEVEPVIVSKIEQGVGVTVNENGCEAAAYTVVEALSGGALMGDPKEIKLDRPFLFTIEGPRLEDGSAVILFIGVVENPAK